MSEICLLKHCIGMISLGFPMFSISFAYKHMPPADKPGASYESEILQSMCPRQFALIRTKPLRATTSNAMSDADGSGDNNT